MSKTIKIFAGVIIAAAALMAVLSSWDDSVVVDEVPHIGAAYSYVTKHDMRLNFEHPPLAKDLAGIPLAFLHLKQGAFNSRFWQTDVNGQWEFGRLFLFNSGNDADQIKHYARLPLIAFLILSAVLVFRWARRLYGDPGAITALVLFVFSPTLLAHSRFVTTDMAALFGTLYATYFFLKYLREPTKANFVWAGLTFGLALIAKFSTVLLIPFFILLAICKVIGAEHKATVIWRNIGRVFAVFIIGTIAVLWPVYYLHVYNYPAERQRDDTRSILYMVYGGQENIRLRAAVWASDKPLLRPLAQYVLGVLRVAHQTLEPHDIYFLGEVRLYGSHAYFPIVYFLKEPLAWWGFVLIALLLLGWQTKKPSRESIRRGANFIKNHFEEFAMLVWLVIYWTISMRGTLNIGVRHLLPVYPFMILLVSGQLSRLINMARARSQEALAGASIVLAALLGWYVYESVHVYPYYLTYFNQIAGGPGGGYRYVVDSNLDWGQDLIRFSNWVKANSIPHIEFDYFGWADASYYLDGRYIWLSSNRYRDANDFRDHNQSDGWLAVSATFLQSSTGSAEHPQAVNYTWLKTFQPVAIIGHSIFVYHIK